MHEPHVGRRIRWKRKKEKGGGDGHADKAVGRGIGGLSERRTGRMEEVEVGWGYTEFGGLGNLGSCVDKSFRLRTERSREIKRKDRGTGEKGTAGKGSQGVVCKGGVGVGGRRV